MNGYTNRPETALDDLIAEQAMDNHIPARRADDFDPFFTPSRRVSRYCRRCGGWNGHHHVMCDAQ